MMLIKLILPRPQAFESTQNCSALGLVYCRCWHDDDEGHDAERKSRVDGSCFGCQIVDHILPVLANAALVVQGLAVEYYARAVRTIRHVVVLGRMPPITRVVPTSTQSGCIGVSARGLGVSTGMSPSIAASALPKAWSNTRPKSMLCFLSNRLASLVVALPLLRALPSVPSQRTPHSPSVAGRIRTGGI